MGKSYNNVCAGSNSEHFRSDKARKFSKRKKRYTHKQIRESNKNSNEETFIKNNWFSNYNCMNDHFASEYISRIGNIPNNTHLLFTNNEYIKYDKNDKNLLDILNRNIEIYKSEPNNTILEYLKSTKKQIERRNKVGLFYGHENNKIGY